MYACVNSTLKCFGKRDLDKSVEVQQKVRERELELKLSEPATPVTKEDLNSKTFNTQG